MVKSEVFFRNKLGMLDMSHEKHNFPFRKRQLDFMTTFPGPEMIIVLDFA